MHKIFAKPLFLGKKVVFLPQCHSTNEQMLNLVKKSPEPEGFILYTDHQEKGRGQRGNVWVDEAGKNILMSVLLKPGFLRPEQQYFLNLIVGLAAVDALSNYPKSEKLYLKWPNDIYINSKKIGGILIESNFRGSNLDYSVAGIGINVNQNGFGLVNATSLALETGSQLDRREIMEAFLQHLEKWYLKLKSGKRDHILEEYHKVLFWKDEIHAFRANEEEFEGIIKGIDKYGKLELIEGTDVRFFGVKEIEFLR